MLLQECAPQGDLSDRLQESEFKPTERVLCTIFEQICDAMMFLADNGIVHGDLACRNVLVFRSDPTEPKKNLVKLTDFGLTRASSLYSVVDNPTRTTMTIIPLRYAAPELLQDTSRLKYSEKSDMYSMGTLMWEACTYGELPYSYLDTDNDVRRTKLNDERLPRPTLCGEQLWTIINECWHQNPDKRPDFQRLKQFVTWPSIDINKRKFSFCNSWIYIYQYYFHIQESVKKPTTFKSIVRSPCEYCNEPIDLSNTSTHAVKLNTICPFLNLHIFCYREFVPNENRNQTD
jgi:serine/threonine protein kinase